MVVNVNITSKGLGQYFKEGANEMTLKKRVKNQSEIFVNVTFRPFFLVVTIISMYNVTMFYIVIRY